MTKASPVSGPATLLEQRFSTSLQYRITSLHSALFKGAAREYAKKADVGLPEARVLQIIALATPVSASDVAQSSAMDKGQVSRAIAALIKRGYVKRASKPGGGRRVMLSLTRSGRSKAQKTLEIGQSRQDRLNAGLTKPERDQLIGLLDRLVVRVREMNAEDLGEDSVRRKVA